MAGDPAQAVSLAAATPADLDLLHGYMRGLRTDDPFPATTSVNDAAARAAVAGLLADPALGRVWLIRSGAAAVGYVALTFGYSLEFGGRSAFIDELYIESAARGRGVGRRALGLVADAAERLGVRVLLLEVSAVNERAFGLYHSAGFAPRGYRLMAKRLG